MTTQDPEAVVAIAGANGFLGRSLTRHLLDMGHRVVALSRSALPSNPRLDSVVWDGRTMGDWVDAINNTDALVNLVGRTVDCIKTPDHRDEILRSRVESTAVLGQAATQCDNPPRAWVQMSTAHIYGDPPTLRCTESSPTGLGLAPDVGRAWEQAFNDSCPDTIRKVILRPGFVLGSNAGALKRLLFLVRLGLGGTVGHGNQGMSWIHQHDFNRIVERAITTESMQGIYNVSAPNPVSNKELMRTLRKTKRMPVGLPAFEWMVRIGAPLIMRTDPELAIYGRYILPQRLLDENFKFNFPELDEALANLI
ncbi:MAG: TIGR01777 family oxidoreductase [Planctomycetota bacterium]|jgi:uncharacterized protein (TIGR01777 family)